MSQVYLSLGSNLGNRYKYIKAAIEIIHKQAGTVIHISDIYETESWAYSDNDYLNCVIELESSLSPLNLLKKCQEIEKSLGRTLKTVIKSGKAEYQARPIDIDILFYDDKITETYNLVIPHPQLHLRNFVLKPLLQIASGYLHPVFQENIDTLYIRCEDKSRIELYKKVKLTDFNLP